MIRHAQHTEDVESYFTPSGRPASRRYAVAVALVLIAASLVALPAWLASFPLFIFFIAAIAGAQAYGGLGPGLLATVMALGMSIYLFLPPFISWTTEPESKRLWLYYGLALVFSYLYSRWTRYRLR